MKAILMFTGILTATFALTAVAEEIDLSGFHASMTLAEFKKHQNDFSDLGGSVGFTRKPALMFGAVQLSKAQVITDYSNESNVGAIQFAYDSKNTDRLIESFKGTYPNIEVLCTGSDSEQGTTCNLKNAAGGIMLIEHDKAIGRGFGALVLITSDVNNTLFPKQKEASKSGNESFDFKGIELGAFSTPAIVEHTLGIKCDRGIGGMQVCNGNTTVAGVYADINLVVASSGKVTRIHLTMSSDYFGRVVQGAIEKYGQPSSSDKSQVQNRMGAQFVNDVLIWGSPERAYVRLKRYASNLDRSSLYFGTAEDTALLQSVSAPKQGDF